MLDSRFHADVQKFLAPVDKDLFIDGKAYQSTSDKRIEVVNPATGSVIATVPDANQEDINVVVASARQAFDSGVWSDMPPTERERRLLNLVQVIENHAEELQHLLVAENGKLLSAAQREVGGASRYTRYAAGWTTKIAGETLDVSYTAPNTDYFAYTVREPLGVVVGIIPWNFPLNMAIWKSMSALACGNTIILKPSEETPLSALRLAELALEADIPAGVINVVTGYGHTAGASLVSHPDINKVAFTGSTATGKKIGQAALANMTRVSLELGGKGAVIVLEDADMSSVPAHIAKGIFYNQGQVCAAGSRVYVHKSHFEQVVESVGQIANKMTIGSGLDSGVQLGPLVSQGQHQRVLNYIGQGLADGADLAFGGQAVEREGYFVEPTVLVNTSQEMSVVQEEIFGPVLVAMPFDNISDVIRMANDSPYGLGAAIFTNNLSRAHRMIKKLKAGSVYVNSPVRIDANLPFGGYKQSGYGREHGSSIIDTYTELKSVVIGYNTED
ncbi:MAG: aldehyde dehydrogenase family protein [Phototrophicaceae bacterium]